MSHSWGPTDVTGTRSPNAVRLLLRCRAPPFLPAPELVGDKPSLQSRGPFSRDHKPGCSCSSGGGGAPTGPARVSIGRLLAAGARRPPCSQLVCPARTQPPTNILGPGPLALGVRASAGAHRGRRRKDTATGLPSGHKRALAGPQPDLPHASAQRTRQSLLARSREAAEVSRDVTSGRPASGDVTSGKLGLRPTVADRLRLPALAHHAAPSGALRSVGRGARGGQAAARGAGPHRRGRTILLRSSPAALPAGTRVFRG